MNVVQGIDGLDATLGRLFVVVGVFDGLHLGHRYLLDHLVDAARRRDARPAVLTFDHHPDEVITGAAPPLLCDAGERLDRLAAAAVEVTIVQHFDRALRETPYDAFVRRIAERVDLAGFLMTPDSAFGFERRGNPDTVAALGEELGFEVEVVAPFVLDDGRAVSSSEIRRAIAEGDLATAERLLGRPYAIVGRGTRSRRDPVLSFEMPVALPPEGTYPVHIDDVDEATEHGPDHAHVEAGSVRLCGIWLGGPRLRLTFEPAAG